MSDTSPEARLDQARASVAGLRATCALIGAHLADVDQDNRIAAALHVPDQALAGVDLHLQDRALQVHATQRGKDARQSRPNAP